jgi:hypothetical protein
LALGGAVLAAAIRSGYFGWVIGYSHIACQLHCSGGDDSFRVIVGAIVFDHIKCFSRCRCRWFRFWCLSFGVFVSVVVVIQVSIGDGAVFVFFGVGIAELLVFIKGI